MNEELNKAVEALTDEDIAELAGGKLSERGAKVAKVAGMVGGGVVGLAGLGAAGAALAGYVKHNDAAYYFKLPFKKDVTDPTVPKGYNAQGLKVTPTDGDVSGLEYGGDESGF